MQVSNIAKLLCKPKLILFKQKLIVLQKIEKVHKDALF